MTMERTISVWAFFAAVCISLGLIFGQGFQDLEEVYVLKGRVYSANMNRNGWAIKLDALNYTKSVNIPLLLQHRDDPENVLGKVTYYGVEGDYIVFIAELTRTSENTLNVDKILRGYLTNISAGLYVLESKQDYLGEDFIKIVTQGDLTEISIVVIPAEPEAYITEITKKVTNG